MKAILDLFWPTVVIIFLGVLTLLLLLLRRMRPMGLKPGDERFNHSDFSLAMEEALRKQKGGERLVRVFQFIQRLPPDVLRNREEMVKAVADHLGVKESLAAVIIKRIFAVGARVNRKLLP